MYGIQLKGVRIFNYALDYMSIIGEMWNETEEDRDIYDIFIQINHEVRSLLPKYDVNLRGELVSRMQLVIEDRAGRNIFSGNPEDVVSSTVWIKESTWYAINQKSLTKS